MKATSTSSPQRHVSVIQRSSWKHRSRKFATRKQLQATAKMRCLGDVPNLTILLRYLPTRAGRGPEPRPAQRRWAPKGAWGASSATGCLLSPCGHKGGRSRDRSALFAIYLTHPPLLTLTYARKRKDRPD